MAENGRSALIVAQPSRMRDGLRALLRTVSNLKTIAQAEDGLSALELMNQHHPTLILLGSNLSNEDIRAVLGQAKTGPIQTRCLVLANNVHQQSIALENGADSVLLIGFPTEKFFTTVEELLSTKAA